jgi:predicted metal-dependent phosphoesterase TrpH
VRLKLSGTYQLLVYADGVNVLADIIRYDKNTETLIDASKEVGLK